MRSNVLILVVLFGCSLQLAAQKPFAMGNSVVVNNTQPVTLDVDFSNAPPVTGSPYLVETNWKVQWRANADDMGNDVLVVEVTVDGTSHLKLRLAPTPQVTNAKKLFWSVLFRADTLPFALINFTPKPAANAGHSCTDKMKKKPALCPPGPKDTPDISLIGSFLAGGGTNPIYSLDFTGGYIFSNPIPGSGLYPALTGKVEINQDTKPPNNRTRFDPDSITAAFALTKYDDRRVGILRGMRYQFQVPTGELSRSDPSSNVTTAALAIFDFNPWLQSPRWFGTFYPFVGMEAGRNLNRPSVIDQTPVDLSHFKSIVRGYIGADTILAYVDENDPTTNLFSIGATYRVRLPAVDEPFVETLHQVTTIDLTTKARHWVEADVNYTLPKWKYLSFTATYQYGDLPPLFSFVNHKVTIGLNLQAVQTSKGLTKLVQ
ncbi:MAG TPA: hypothetical protein VGK24_10690 [Candidatus Angelobacter sp.]|jgi:hypothetical protein